MGPKTTGAGTQAERFTQLAELHRQGVLSAEDYEAAVSRVVVESSPDEPAVSQPPSTPSKQEDVVTPVASAGESRSATDPTNRAPKSDAVGVPERNRVPWVATVGVAVVILVIMTVVLLARGSANGDQKACDLFHQATEVSYQSAQWSDLIGQATTAAKSQDLIDALELLGVTTQTESGYAAYGPVYSPPVESLCSNLQG